MIGIVARFPRRWAAGLAAISLGWMAAAHANAATPPAGRPAVVPAAFAAPQRQTVPEFPAGLSWINTDRPLSLQALRGKVVLLDFWTYGCINCMHILPDLKRLERKYPNELVIISVHTAKFANEDETQNIRNAVIRYNIEHPILNDARREYWTRLGVNVWPTQVLIDPRGGFVGGVEGEGNYQIVDRTIAQVIAEAKAAGTLNTKPFNITLDAHKVADTPLSYPGKILADLGPGRSDRLYISDSRHNRVIIASPTGEVEAVAGTGVVGKSDGSFHDASFSNPQGLALRKDADGTFTLYVADTNNHSIRALDLKRGAVSTIAGNGKQAPVTRRPSGGVGTGVSLSSPWDLLLVGKTLYVAMAGPHQIWSMNLDSGAILPYAGSGQEARTDGGLRTAAFAQPSGLATDGKRLFVADSESSSIRAVDLAGGAGKVTTIAGGDLFEFGDVEGAGLTARFQHPLAVSYGDDVLYVADTYNHKIKRIDPATGVSRTFLGGGKGLRDGAQPQFYEPGGLSLAGKKLYVADTNNHRISVVDLDTKTASTLTLKNLPTALPAEPERAPVPVDPDADAVKVPLANLAPNSQGEVVLELKLPAGYHVSPDAQHRVRLSVEGEGVTLGRATVPAAEVTLPLRVPLTTGKVGAKGSLAVKVSLFYCSDTAKLCRMKTLSFRAPFTVREDGAKALTIKATL